MHIDIYLKQKYPQDIPALFAMLVCMFHSKINSDSVHRERSYVHTYVCTVHCTVYVQCAVCIYIIGICAHSVTSLIRWGNRMQEHYLISTITIIIVAL